jgi:hypothetical protein
MISNKPQPDVAAAVALGSAAGDPLADRALVVTSSLPADDLEAVDPSPPPSPVVKHAHRAFSPAMTAYIVATVASVAFLGPLGANVSVPGYPLLPKQPADHLPASPDLYPRPPRPL